MNRRFREEQHISEDKRQRCQETDYLDAVSIIDYTGLNNQQEANPKFYIVLENLHQQILLQIQSH